MAVAIQAFGSRLWAVVGLPNELSYLKEESFDTFYCLTCSNTFHQMSCRCCCGGLHRPLQTDGRMCLTFDYYRRLDPPVSWVVNSPKNDGPECVQA